MLLPTVAVFNSDIWTSFKKHTVFICGFLAGCVIGALMAQQLGIVSLCCCPAG